MMDLGKKYVQAIVIWISWASFEQNVISIIKCIVQK
jgi:hypothetical protein